MNLIDTPLRVRHALFRVVVGLVVASSAASADVLIEQGPIPIQNPALGNVGISSVAPLDEAREFTSRAYDDFTISEEVQITGVTWRGAFNQLFNPNDEFRGIVDFRIEVLQDADNRPNTSAVVSSHLLDGGTAGRNDGADVMEAIVPDQAHKSGGAIVSYEAELSPFVLAPGNYWLSIQALQTFPSPFPPQFPDDPNKHFDPSWSWILSKEGNTSMYQFDEFFGDTLEPGAPIHGWDTTFSLLGNSLVQITGDFDHNGVLEALDIDLLTAAIRENSTDGQFDVNQDGTLSDADLTFWVETLKGTFAGDADLNLEVAFVDFLALARNYNQEGGWAEGNFDTNTTINFPDFLQLARNFGLKADGQVAAAAVPEPCSAWLAILGFLATARLYRRRRV